MKPNSITPCLFGLIVSFPLFSQSLFPLFPQTKTVELQYSLSNPIGIGSMRKSILASHEKASFGGIVSFQAQKFIKGSQNRLVGLEYNLGISSIFVDGVNQKVYTLDDGSQAKINTEANTRFNSLLFTYTHYFFETKKVQPFILAKAGLGRMKTEVGIFDADNDDTCTPLDSKVLAKSFTPVAAFGAGFSFDLAIFNGIEPNFLFFNLSAIVNQGTNINYASTNDLNSSQFKIINARFVNNTTGVVHEHAVGNSNRALYQMAEIKAGLMLRL